MAARRRRLTRAPSNPRARPEEPAETYQPYRSRSSSPNSKAGPREEGSHRLRAPHLLLANDSRNALVVPHVGHQAIQFLLDYAIALAGAGLQSGTIKHCNVPTTIANESGVLQPPGGFRNAFPAHAEHAGHQLLRHDQLSRGNAIERRQ